ncbi:hypothetical protein [Paenibacillus sp. MDMC362]|uniref:hypothetical protein n=1 Tax=Paenibacillus sp. MDMC362 TaxID=2977365 RepID=UPI0011BEDB32|nr:hypothetical protein [Paenibacillus sp. MDMC362]
MAGIKAEHSIKQVHSKVPNQHQETHNQNPTTIYISSYITDSTKVQPELINVVGVGDPDLLKQVNDWKKEGIQGIQATLPSPDKIDRIYVLQYAYEGANPKSIHLFLR